MFGRIVVTRQEREGRRQEKIKIKKISAKAKYDIFKKIEKNEKRGV